MILWGTGGGVGVNKQMNNSNKIKTDWIVTIVPVATVIVMALMFAFQTEKITAAMEGVRDFFVNDLGFTYIIVGLFMLIVSIWVAFSKFGNIKLGNVDKPEYSTFSWGSMVFTSTMAADVLYWSIIEWAYYAMEDPFGLGETRTMVDFQNIMPAYSMFHWGPMGWVFYILPAAAFAYMIYIKKAKFETLSEGCRPILGKKVDGPLGRLIDIFCIVGLLAGCATIFSVATPMITGCIIGATGMPDSKWITIGVLAFTAIVFTLAVLVGMKAIEWVAAKSVYLYILLGGICLFFGPTRYIIETAISAVGFTAENFIKMSTWMDPLRLSGSNGFGFPQNWTIFFYANWISWSVATPLFIAKISKGRTLRQLILGGYATGIAATYLSFSIFGNYSMNLEVTGAMDISGMLAEGASTAQVIMEIMSTLPLSKILMVITVFTMIGLYASTFDATSLILAGFSQKHREKDTMPTKGIMIFWSVVLILLPIAMVFAESLLPTMKAVSVSAAFPIMVIEMIIIFGFIKELRAIGKTAPVPPMKEKEKELVFDEKQFETYWANYRKENNME